MERILVCEDHRIVYEGLELLLSKDSRYSIVGHASNGKDLVPFLTQAAFDILILDLNLPDTDGFALLKEVKKRIPSARVIILTMYHDSFLVEKAKEAGASGYLLKNSSNEELLHALEKSAQVDFYLTPAIQNELDQKKIYRDRFAQKMKLTRRELEIVQNLARGLSSQQIADQLFLSLHTVETHRKNIFRKLEINNIADLVRFAHDSKIL